MLYMFIQVCIQYNFTFVPAFYMYRYVHRSPPSSLSHTHNHCTLTCTMPTKHWCVAAHCGYHFISCLIELQHVHTIEHYLLQKHLLHEPRGWGPAQCNILDPLCPNEPKEENLAGTILSFDYFIFFFLAC